MGVPGGAKQEVASLALRGPERDRSLLKATQQVRAGLWPRPLCLEGPRCSPLRAQLGGRGVADGMPSPPADISDLGSERSQAPPSHVPPPPQHRGRQRSPDASRTSSPAYAPPPASRGTRAYFFYFGGSLEGAVLVAYLKEASLPTHTQSFLPSVCGFRFLGARRTGCGLT